MQKPGTELGWRLLVLALLRQEATNACEQLLLDLVRDRAPCARGDLGDELVDRDLLALARNQLLGVLLEVVGPAVLAQALTDHLFQVFFLAGFGELLVDGSSHGSAFAGVGRHGGWFRWNFLQ